jgi:hypothetical protein
MIDPARVTGAPPRRKRKTPTTKPEPRFLIPRNFHIDVDSDRSVAVCDELRALRLDRFPNSIGITFRSLVEMAVTRYLHQTGELAKLRATIAKKQTITPDWVPSLDTLLQHILQTSTIPLAADARRALANFVKDRHGPMSLDAMNSFTHNRFTPPTPDQLRKLWTMLRPLLELTLQDAAAEEESKARKKK